MPWQSIEYEIYCNLLSFRGSLLIRLEFQLSFASFCIALTVLPELCR